MAHRNLSSAQSPPLLDNPSSLPGELLQFRFGIMFANTEENMKKKNLVPLQEKIPIESGSISELRERKKQRKRCPNSKG